MLLKALGISEGTVFHVLRVDMLKRTRMFVGDVDKMEGRLVSLVEWRV